MNATRKRAKVLLWDGTGLCIYAKRLEQGRFACLWREATARVVRLTMSELQLFLEGSGDDADAKRRREELGKALQVDHDVAAGRRPQGRLVGRVALSPAPFVVGQTHKELAGGARR